MCWNSNLVVVTIWLGPDRPNRDTYLLIIFILIHLAMTRRLDRFTLYRQP